MRTAFLVLSAGLALGAVLWTFQRRLIYFPFGEVPNLASMGIRGASPVSFPTDDGLILQGWLVGDPATARLTAIVFNGNAGNRAFRLPLATALERRGIAVLLFDYRGFGGNPGTPTEGGLRSDARAARNFVLSLGVNPNRLVYLGESLGAAVATELAAAYAPAALILRSPFTSLADVGRLHYRFLAVQWFLRDRYATIDLIQHIRAPILVIAGDRDRIVPVEQSRRLFDSANEPKSLFIVGGADHNDGALLAGREMIDRIVTFVEPH